MADGEERDIRPEEDEDTARLLPSGTSEQHTFKVDHSEAAALNLTSTSSSSSSRGWKLLAGIAGILAITLILWRAAAGSSHGQERSEASELDPWIRNEVVFAKERILENIGPACGAADGLVIASPSRMDTPDQPDYYYTWTRDSALTISSLLPAFLPSHYLRPWIEPLADSAGIVPLNETDPLVETLVRAYVAAQADLQLVETPSGDLQTGGLNEPKYHVNGTAFTGSWGRPQRDGPALRALTLIPYANFLLDRGWPADVAYVQEKLYDPGELKAEGKVVKNDLEEVAHGWQEPGFDLWEEVDGHHLFTRMMSLRALQAGTLLATRLKDDSAAAFYTSQAETLLRTMSDFYEPSTGIWNAMLPLPDLHRTGLDCAFPLSVIHSGGEDMLAVGKDDGVLATMREYILSFDGLYDVNKGKQWVDGWALGRYREDVYDGVAQSKANPWFICTYSTAHVLYLVEDSLMAKGKVEMTNLTIPFWRDVMGDDDCAPEVSVQWSLNDGQCFARAVKRVREVGNGFMTVGRKYSVEGRMSEQIERHTGKMRGARDLTWSYASFLSAARQRANVRSAADAA